MQLVGRQGLLRCDYVRVKMPGWPCSSRTGSPEKRTLGPRGSRSAHRAGGVRTWGGGQLPAEDRGRLGRNRPCWQTGLGLPALRALRSASVVKASLIFLRNINFMHRECILHVFNCKWKSIEGKLNLKQSCHNLTGLISAILHINPTSMF